MKRSLLERKRLRYNRWQELKNKLDMMKRVEHFNDGMFQGWKLCNTVT